MAKQFPAWYNDDKKTNADDTMSSQTIGNTHVSGWRSIRKGKPASDIRVLVWGRIYGQPERSHHAATYYPAMNKFFSVGEVVEDVSHWMLMPPAPACR